MSNARAVSDVLHALTGRPGPRTYAEAWGHHDVSIRPNGARVASYGAIDDGPHHEVPWSVGDASEALEGLVSRGLVPPRWTDPDGAPWWWCGNCGGGRRCAGGVCRACQRSGVSSAPGSVPRPDRVAALASVACLGVEVLARVECTVAEGWPGATVVWCSLNRASLAHRHSTTRRIGRDDYEAFCEQAAARAKDPSHAWPTSPPDVTDAATFSIARIWPHLGVLFDARVHYLGSSMREVAGLRYVSLAAESDIEAERRGLHRREPL